MATRKQDGTWAKRKVPGFIYVVHFDSPILYERRTRSGEIRVVEVWHYLGWTCDVAQRVDRHMRGDGSKLLRALNERGIGWKVVAVYGGTRVDERRMKAQRNAKRFCPCCGGSVPKGCRERAAELMKAEAAKKAA